MTLAMALVFGAFAVLVTMIVVARKAEKKRMDPEDDPMLTLNEWLDGPSEL